MAAATRRTDDELDLDHELRRIAEHVRRVADARAVLISQVDDGEDGMRVVAGSGAVVGGDVAGLTWRRADLDECLVDAERHGRLRFTPRRSITHAALADGDPDGLSSGGTLLAPLLGADGALLGVVSADGPVEPSTLGDAACELLEVYAGQARLALQHRAERDRLAELRRLTEATRTIVQGVGVQPDITRALASLVGSSVDLLDVRAAWACAEHPPGAHADATSYPVEVADLLGPDVCTVLEPVVAAGTAGDHALTEGEDEILAKVAAHAGHPRVLLVAIGSGAPVRGALLLFRDSDEAPWSQAERTAALAIGRSVGSVLPAVAGRDHDRRLVEELRELDRYKRDMVASISHDLKSPLTSITLNAEVLESGQPTAAVGATQVAAIRRSAERLGRLVDDLLALARAEETPTGPAAEVDVVALVREACHHVQVEAQERNISLTVELPESLTLPVDGDALRRVFVQILANAVKFSLAGGQVRVALARVGDMAEFVCADDGIGIAASDHGAVFDMFKRAEDPRARVVPGSGMGLAIAHRIVSRLGGTIHVDSVRGAGATFRVRVPAAH